MSALMRSRTATSLPTAYVRIPSRSPVVMVVGALAMTRSRLHVVAELVQVDVAHFVADIPERAKQQVLAGFEQRLAGRGKRQVAGGFDSARAHADRLDGVLDERDDLATLGFDGLG